MALEFKDEKLSKKAENTIGSLRMEYSFEHAKGEAPDIVRGRGVFEGTDTVLDVTYAPASRNFNASFHYLKPKTDMSMLSKVLADLEKLAKG